MENKFKITGAFKLISWGLIAIGLITFILGFIYHPESAWANYLLNNYYFLALAIGGTFWLAIQRITQSGWSSAYIRIPEAFANYIPLAAVFFVLMWFGFHDLYHWTHEKEVMQDEILQHKAPYLNIPFFVIRLIIYFAIWIYLTQKIRKVSLEEDRIDGMRPFEKSEWYSKVYIFALALTFTLASIDWIMSIDPHWYSTIFSLKNFLTGFYHGSALIVLIVIIMHKYGYYRFLNNSHMIDFSKYVFILSILWGYFWFSQFLLMWYANIPEETIYYVTRIEGPWSTLFWLNIILNTGVPFVFLLSNYLAKSKVILAITVVIIMIGMWIDLYLQIMPGARGEHHIGLLEIGSFLGYLGLFAWVVGRSMNKRALIPENHPLLEESTEHHLHEL
ncbi:MAG: hypothetical protein K9G67_01975 [Bacteroidales bacterium]|nr:hypothetical protein [Bacteroidales bacterium]MCF8349540.1 hypothetical protein [Bacteroidales bacterium]MCF8375099.1 hypothetical protein [Bacteroidales bacterium]MCF8400006.1 hypothetical protein [Bacteroidales bacterium]